MYPSTENMTNPARKLVRQLILLVTMASLWTRKCPYIILLHENISMRCLYITCIHGFLVNGWFSSWLNWTAFWWYWLALTIKISIDNNECRYSRSLSIAIDCLVLTNWTTAQCPSPENKSIGTIHHHYSANTGGCSFFWAIHRRL